MPELVLVTGACGFIGLHIVKRLLTEGYRVRGTVRSLENEELPHLEALKNDLPEASLEVVEAELTDAECWKKVVADCDYVLHVACPFPIEDPTDADELLKPSVDGTLNVLKACGSGVKRVVLTGSYKSLSCGHTKPPSGDKFTEEHWAIECKEDTLMEKIKAVAEKAAWEYMDARDKDLQHFDLSVINIGITWGPSLGSHFSTSCELPKRMLVRSMPMIPRLMIPATDVRDVAEAHVAAMKIPEAGGKRHIVCGPSIWLQDLAEIMESEFEPLGYNIPKTYAPYAVMWSLARIDPGVKLVLRSIGIEQHYDNTRMTQVLGVQPTPVQKTVFDMCYSLIEKGIVPKTAQYSEKQRDEITTQ